MAESLAFFDGMSEPKDGFELSVPRVTSWRFSQIPGEMMVADIGHRKSGSRLTRRWRGVDSNSWHRADSKGMPPAERARGRTRDGPGEQACGVYDTSLTKMDRLAAVLSR
jgi:hypothetical protein